MLTARRLLFPRIAQRSTLSHAAASIMLSASHDQPAHSTRVLCARRWLNRSTHARSARQPRLIGFRGTTVGEPSEPKKFGTFGGVFTPCTLTILGVIMFLRFGHVVGQTGVMWALMVLLAAKSITLLTTLSLSAIATNTRLQGGGAYYIITRSLGVEFGGAIGVLFFAAQAISVAMYVIGFSEALLGTLPFLGGETWLVASISNVVVFICVYIGAGWTIRLQYGILAILGAALVSFYWGAFSSFDSATLRANVEPHYLDNDNFFTMFALFFPAVTGIMAGANMSGDLQDPGRAIPRGTLASVAVTALIYGSMVLCLGGARDHNALISNNFVISDIAVSSLLITAGVFAATLSSALGSMMGAPRILQAFARDDIFKSLQFFRTGSGRSNEPRRATVLTFFISQVAILLGDLNALAPIITMAFLITYGTLNLATFYESVTKNPSYRPRFRFSHWSTALAGAAGCLGVMFLLAPGWAVVAMAIMFVLHWAIERKEVEGRWGDLQSGVLFERARKNLVRLEEVLHHPKNWRPIILALSGSGWSRPHLAVYGHWFTAGHGILSLGQVIQGDVEDRLDRRRNQEKVLHSFIRKLGLEGFPAVVVAPELSIGIESLVQCHGLGALRPNTVLLGWPTDEARVQAFGTTLRILAGLERSIVAIRYLKDSEDPREVPHGEIHVWWRGEQNGALMLLLAHLLSKNNEWRSHRIRLLRVIGSEAGRTEVLQHLGELIQKSRIRARPQVVVSDDVPAAIYSTSRRAALVFLGFEAPSEGAEEAFHASMERLAGRLPRVVLVDSIGGMSLDT